ncbi:MAG: NUDIX hydrolase [Planctomycetota bacterium]
MKSQSEIPLTYAAFGYLKNSEGKVLMVANDYSRHGIMWGLPGGAMEEGESPEDCVVREFSEEIGLAVTVSNPVGVIERFKPEWDLNLYAYFFEVDLVSGNPRIDPDEEHVIDFAYLSVEDIKNKKESILGRMRIVDYLNNPEQYPQNIVMGQDEE